MQVLVDTSVWVDHFRHCNDQLAQALALDMVLIHPLILTELACGTPPSPRQKTLEHLGRLRQPSLATTEEVISLIERERLYGQGCGAVDLTLLACTLLTPETHIWTLDKRLDAMAASFNRRWPH